MPIDRMFIDPVLTPFKNMVKDLEDKGKTGEKYQKMVETLNAIEKLADEENDLNSFNAKVTAEGYYMKFSQYYSEALSEAAQEESSATDDETLLKNTLKAYEDAIIQLENSNAADKKRLIEPIQTVIDLGKSGISFPEFLRIIEEKGLTKAMDGTVTLRDYISKDIKYTEDFYMPVHKEMYEKMLKCFDELTTKASFGIPDSFEYGLARQKIEWEFLPKLNKWKIIIEHWNKIINRVYDWLDSFCSFAPYDERWRTPGATEEMVIRNIKRTQVTSPYYLVVREKTFFDYFSLKWNDIWTHETYLNEKKANRIIYSDARIELIKKTYLQIEPQSKPSDDLIKLSEEMHDNKTYLNLEYRKELSEKAQKIYEEGYGKKFQ